MRKKSDFKYFEKQNYFNFLIENFMLTKNALDVYLSILRVVKIFVRMIKKIIISRIICGF
jgi:hypothetical protein